MQTDSKLTKIRAVAAATVNPKDVKKRPTGPKKDPTRCILDRIINFMFFKISGHDGVSHIHVEENFNYQSTKTMLSEKQEPGSKHCLKTIVIEGVLN